MKNLLKIFLGLLFICILAYFYLLSQGYEYAVDYVVLSIASTIAIPYFLFFKNKKLFFSLFLICFCLGDLMYYVLEIYYYWRFYYLKIMLYALAYTFLFVETIRFLNFRKIVKRFKMQLLMLLGLSLCIGYITVKIEIYCFEKDFIMDFRIIDYVTSIYYQVFLCLMLSGSVINFLDKYDKKSLYLFLGCTSLIFMELLGVALYILSITKTKGFFIIYIVLSLISFYFLIKQSDLEYKKNDVPFNQDF